MYSYKSLRMTVIYDSLSINQAKHFLHFGMSLICSLFDIWLERLKTHLQQPSFHYLNDVSGFVAHRGHFSNISLAHRMWTCLFRSFPRPVSNSVRRGNEKSFESIFVPTRHQHIWVIILDTDVCLAEKPGSFQFVGYFNILLFLVLSSSATYHPSILHLIQSPCVKQIWQAICPQNLFSSQHYS